MDFDLLAARLARVLFPTPDCRRAVEEENDALKLVELQEGFIEAIKQVLYLFEFDSKSYRDIREVLISCQWFQYEVEHFRIAPISSDDAKSRLGRMLEAVDKSKVFLDLLASCEHEEDRPTLPAAPSQAAPSPAAPSPAAPSPAAQPLNESTKTILVAMLELKATMSNPVCQSDILEQAGGGADNKHAFDQARKLGFTIGRRGLGTSLTETGHRLAMELSRS